VERGDRMDKGEITREKWDLVIWDMHIGFWCFVVVIVFVVWINFLA
jgi:hypothetical protein